MAINSCNHVFCIKCAKESVQTGEGCNICGAAIMKSSIKVVLHQRDPGDAVHMLFGQTPEFIMQSCNSAMQFCTEQHSIEVNAAAQKQLEQQKQDFVNFEEAVKSKLTEIHKAYKRYKEKCGELVEEQASLVRDRNELQEKYAQKTAQARRLQEICDNQQKEIHKLKKVRGAPFFDARPQVSEDSYQIKRQNNNINSNRNILAISNANRNLYSGQHQPEAFPKHRATSEVSSFQAPARPNISSGFRASKKRIFEITNTPANSQWDQQWTVRGKQNTIVNLDPFEISANPGEFLN